MSYQGSTFEVGHEEAIVTKRSTGKMGQLLSQYKMLFLPQKVVKGHAVADFLAEHPDPKATELYEDLSEEVAKVCLTQTSFVR